MPSELILENENLIYSMSKQFYGVEREDLIQAGFLGLTKAYKKYDPNTGTKFSTYAYGFIYGEMYEAATGNRPIHVRKNELRLYNGVLRTKVLLEEKMSRPVSYEETCHHLGVDYPLFISILNSMSAFVSTENVETSLKAKESNRDDLIMLKESLNRLSPLERSVMANRYVGDRSQNETAKILGLSQVKVSRLEKASREKMKKYMTS